MDVSPRFGLAKQVHGLPRSETPSAPIIPPQSGQMIKSVDMRVPYPLFDASPDAAMRQKHDPMGWKKPNQI
jgi:hypothetical protein